MSTATKKDAGEPDISSRGSVRISADPEQLVIDGYRTNDPELVEHFRKLGTNEREEVLSRILRFGVAVDGTVRASKDVHFVKKEVRELIDEVETALDEASSGVAGQIDERLDPSEEGSHTARLQESLATAKKELVGELEEIREGLDEELDPNRKGSYPSKIFEELSEFEGKLKEMFDQDRSDSVPAKISSVLEEALSEDGHLSKVLETQLSLKDESSPLGQIHRQVAQLRDEIAKREAAEAVAEQTPLKGDTFEDDVEARLEQLAKGRTGETVENVTEKGSKKGDFLYHLKDGSVVGIEARDREIRSLPKMQDELDEVLSARNADYAVYVVADREQLQQQMGRWDEYEGDKAVTSFDLLPLTIRFARVRLKSRSQAAEGIDLDTLGGEVESIERSLQKVGTIKRQVTEAEKAGNRIREHVDDLKTEIVESLALIEDQLDEGAESSTT